MENIFTSTVVVKTISTSFFKGQVSYHVKSSQETKCCIIDATPIQEYIENGIISKNKYFDIFFKDFKDYEDNRNGAASIIVDGDTNYKIIGTEIKPEQNYYYARAVLSYEDIEDTTVYNARRNRGRRY